jgi:hypothetical protein
MNDNGSAKQQPGVAHRFRLSAACNEFRLMKRIACVLTLRKEGLISLILFSFEIPAYA